MNWAGWVYNLYFELLLCSIAIFSSNKADQESKMGHYMVETNQLKEKGLNSGALKEDKEGDVLFINEGWHRICAPLEKEKKTHPLIFWNKSNPEDKPSWDKQVSSHCHCLPQFWFLKKKFPKKFQKKKKKKKVYLKVFSLVL